MNSCSWYQNKIFQCNVICKATDITLLKGGVMVEYCLQ